MAAADVPDQVRRFLSRYIRSLEQLEVLMLVSALPDREWTVDAVFSVVQTNRSLVQQRLDEFVKQGILMRGTEGVYRFAPQSDALAKDIAAMASFYKLSRHKVIELIYATPSDDILKFSDAFRFKKGDSNG
jgi:hypothetical protein